MGMIFASLIVAEIILRLTTDTELINIEPNPYTLYKTKSNAQFETTIENFTNAITTNSYGFFDKEWTLEKKTDKRILIVGDSFTEGYTVPFDKHYARMFETLANNQSAMSIEVMSAGTSSWDTSSEIKVLERELLKFNPDIVILQIYIGNDIHDNRLKGIFTLQNGSLVDNTPVTIPLAKRVLMYGSLKSYLFKQVTDFFIFNPVGIKLAKLFKGSNVLVFEENELHVRNKYAENSPPMYHEGYALTYQLLERYASLSKEYHFIPVVLIIPEKEQVYDEEWNAINAAAQQNNTFRRDLPQRNIIQHAPTELIIIDVLPQFIEEQSQRYYNGVDLHTNIAGNKRTAEILYEELVDTHILKK